MTSDISAIFWPYEVSFEPFYERHILVLSFVALIIFFLLYAYSIIGMVSDNWTPLGFASLRDGLCGVIQYHQVLREREEESERRQLPLRGRVHPSLPLYTCIIT